MIESLKNLQESKNTCISIGNFDGFHKGHQKLINILTLEAKNRALKSMVVTFSPNPKIFFKRETSLINTDSQKKRILTKQGVERIVILDFNEVVNMEGKDFLNKVLLKRLKMKTLVIGKEFMFGKNRALNYNNLIDLSKEFKFKLIVVEPEYNGENKISSSFIRKLLCEGKIDDANQLLVDNFFIEGVVVKGYQRGRKLGFPTINIKTENLLLPIGVFKTITHIDKRSYLSITNIGYIPTFEEKIGEKRIETYILNFNKEIYGKSVRLEFLNKIRDEYKFSTEKELVERIRKDVNSLIS